MNRRDDWISELHYREFLKPKLQGKDFYWENGMMVMTEDYHKRRGSRTFSTKSRNNRTTIRTKT